MEVVLLLEAGALSLEEHSWEHVCAVLGETVMDREVETGGPGHHHHH